MTKPRPKWYIRWGIQCKLLLWKNAKLSWRRRRDTLAQLIAPFVFIFILWVFQQTLTNRKNFKVIKTSEEIDVGYIPLCVNGPRYDFCYTFLYSPNTSEVESIVNLIRNQNQPAIPSSSVMGFPDSLSMDDFMMNNPNSTQGAYIFNISGDISLGTKQYNYVLQVNFTDQSSYGISISRQERIQMPMKLAADRAILSLVSPGTELDVSYIEFTHPEVVPLNIVGNQGRLWFFAAIMFNFVVGLGSITLEKENKLRDVMKIMGLFDSVFWFTWFITLGILATLTVLMIIVAGAIFQFEFFLNNNFGVYFVLLWLFALTMVAMAFLVSTVVKKSSSSTTIGFVIFIIGFIIQQVATYVYSLATDGDWEWLRPVLAFFSPSMLSVGLNELGTAVEREGSKGLSWSDITNLSKMSNRVITFQEMYGWLILDFFIYLLLALYLDNVLPNEYGTRRPPYYFLTPSYWTGKSRRTSKKSNKVANSAEVVEDEDVKAEKELVMNGKLPQNTVVTVNGLRKVYKDKNAVDGVYFGIESDTLFCLLGPNGAGKTTTIHMLVGFHEPSFGDASIFGNSITSNIDLVQQTMGVCPQFDILWNELTGEEHLHLFSGIKALSKSDRLSETTRLLKAVELEEASHMRSSSYSGGMKRRLSVAISLIGNPSIVFLDEPTTGMDPISRRKVWDIIEEEKKGKVIVLTTHSMEEADILGDKIGIMANGRLQCLGSALHLKQKFGSGYRITVGTSPEKVDEVIAYVHKGIEGVKLIGDRAAITGFMSFAIPRNSKDLVPFFKRIEKDKESLGITDLQLSLTTLEEVFLNIAKSAEEEAEHLKELEDEKKHKKKKAHKADEESLTKTIPERHPSSGKQFSALMIKTLHLQKRDKKMLGCQIFTPIFLIVLLFIFQLIINNLLKSSNPPEPHPPVTPQFFMLPLPSKISQEDMLTRLALLNATGATILYASEIGDIGNYKNGTGLLGTISPSYGQSIPFKFVSFESFYSTDDTIDADTYNLPINFVQVADKEEMDQILYDSFFELPNITAGYIFKQLDFPNKKFKFTIAANATLSSMDDGTFIMSPIVNMIAQNLANVKIQTTGLKSLPTSSSKLQIDIASLIGSFFYILILLLLFPVFLANIAYEKESRVREIMAMNGLKMSMYWIVTYIYDYLFYLCVIAFLIISGFAFQFRMFTINNFLSYFLLFFFWGHVLVALSFLCSVAFDSKKTAILTGYFGVFAIALICLVVVNNTLARIGETSVTTANLLSIFPPFAVYRGLVYLDTQASEAGYTVSNLNTDVVNISQCYYFLIGEWAVLMIIWMYLEQVVPGTFGVKKHPLFFLGCGRKPKKIVVDHKDEAEQPKDIQAESERVFKTVPNDSMPIQVLALQKTYPGIDGNPPKRAVKTVTFGVDDCSSFGILGHNGAGKTTLIHMLIGLFPPSNGDAYVSGKNLTSELDQIHTLMGICPQHDVIWETLTGEEHLMFYGRIKGLSGKALKMRVKECLKKVNLYNARAKLVGSYSGGMKRRLSVAISIVGYPKVLYLDEPSTGLDPKSRQDLWKVIHEAKQTSAVVLTTHSMEEVNEGIERLNNQAETLCDRLMIMAEGEIKCIGVSADLKSRFGEGFKLSIQVDVKHQERKVIDEFVHQLVPAVLINELAGSANYLVPKESVTLEKVFEVMEENKEKLKITDWGITNTTLEEVFLRINKHSKKSKEEEK